MRRFALLAAAAVLTGGIGCGPTPTPRADTGVVGEDTGVVREDTGVPPTDGAPPDTGITPTDGGMPTDASDPCDGVDCSAMDDACNLGTCDASTGACEATPRADGTTCDDGDACTTGDSCTAGTCDAGPSVDCSGSSDACNVGTCNPADGTCTAVPVADATTCDDGDLCTTVDTCVTGTCTGAAPVVCVDDACDLEMCNPATGLCDLTPEAAGTFCSAPISGLCDGAGTCSCGADLECGGMCFASAGCTAGIGACAAMGVLVCDAGGGAATACGAVPGAPSPEICNAVDDDCDGTTDAFSTACYSGPAGTRGVGACVGGTSLCTAGVAGACTGQVVPAAEICGNAIDEDCNGATLACGDTCAAAIPLTIAATGTTVTGTTVGSTNSTPSCSITSDIFYSFTLTTRSLVYVDSFGSAYDTIIGLADTCAATPVCVDDSCMTRHSQTTGIFDPGTHFIVVDGYMGATGAYTLNVQAIEVSGPGNGTLAAGMSTLGGVTVGAPAAVSYCGTGPEHWWSWLTCPTAVAGTLTASTCTTSTWDTQLSLRNGNGAPLCVDDSCGRQSALAAPVTAGAAVHVLMLSGYNLSEAGTYSMPVTRP